MTKPTTIDAALVRALVDALPRCCAQVRQGSNTFARCGELAVTRDGACVEHGSGFEPVYPWAAPLAAVKAALAGQPAESGAKVRRRCAGGECNYPDPSEPCAGCGLYILEGSRS